MPRRKEVEHSQALDAARAAALKELAKPKQFGRPKAVMLDKKTLETIKGLAQIDCTDREISGVLGISQVTWISMKRDHPELADLVEEGRAQGNASLRRQQMAAAAKGNSALLIWLGKQRLGQSDKHEFTGKNGGPMQVIDVTNLSLEQLDQLDNTLDLINGGTSFRLEGTDSGGEEPSSSS